jgi:hypothetical protein
MYRADRRPTINVDTANAAHPDRFATCSASVWTTGNGSDATMTP